MKTLPDKKGNIFLIYSISREFNNLLLDAQHSFISRKINKPLIFDKFLKLIYTKTNKSNVNKLAF